MGSGGSSGPLKIGGISGQGGGRILPGTAGGVGELIFSSPRTDITASVAAGHPDRRPVRPFGSSFDTLFTAPGGAPGQPGQGDSFAVYVFRNSDGTLTPIRPLMGGGGGWGAAGGAATRYLADLTAQTGGNPGAAAGKAIATNGHAITWLGGSARAYGAIG